MIAEKDRKWCAKCIYRARAGGYAGAPYLCNYLLDTGTRRGCPAGVGCTKRLTRRELEQQDRRRVCSVCGVRYEGGKRSHLCPDCRKELHRRNALRMVEIREKKTP